MSALKLVRSNPPKAPEREGAPQAEEITKATIAQLAKLPKSDKDIYVTDSELPGFRIRRTPAGTVTFEYRGRIRGGEGVYKNKVVKRTIGIAKGKGAITVAKARAEALRLREQLAKGIDPTDELKAKAAAVEAAQKQEARQAEVKRWTPAYALEQMLEWRASRPDPSLHLKPETIEFYQRGIGYLGKLAGVPIVDMKVDDIRRALDKIGGVAKPSKAKRALSGVIAHTIRRLELNIANPVSRLERGEFKAPPPRNSYIKEADIGEFVDKVVTLSIPGREREARRARDYVLLALLYGTRKEELMRMEWQWIDWEQGTITLPASATKQKREHVLPLTAWTRAVLEARYARRKPERRYVFPGEKGDQPVTNLRRSLTTAFGDGFKLHDLRRTLITHCSSLGIHGTRLKALVGHARAGVSENYDQREIEQARRDFSTYHEWLKERHYEYGWNKAFPNAAEDAALTDPPAPAKAEQWPGV